MFTDINSEDRLVQKTFADYLHEGRVQVAGTDSARMRSARAG